MEAAGVRIVSRTWLIAEGVLRSRHGRSEGNLIEISPEILLTLTLLPTQIP